MKKASILLIALCLNILLTSCDASNEQFAGTQTKAPSDTISTVAKPEGNNSATVENKPVAPDFSNGLKNVGGVDGFKTDEARVEYIRAYFKSPQYAEDHPDYPDVLWMHDSLFFIPEPWDRQPNQTFVVPYLLDALDDNEKIGLIVTVDRRELPLADLQAEKDYFTSKGFTVVSDVPDDPHSFVIIIQKSQYEEVAALTPYDPIDDLYLITSAGYSDLDLT